MGLRHRQFAMTWSAAMLSASLLGGCLMLPTRDTTEAPPIAPHLPPALLASSDPVIVIAQQSTTKRGSDSWENLSKNIRTWETSHALDIRIVPARALSELHKGLAQSVTSGVWIGMCGGYKCMTHQDAYRWEYLDKLFIVSVDGTEIALRPFPKSWETLWARAINSARRDAIVSALRDSGESPFDKLDGPCGV